MAETAQILFDYKETVEALIKQQGIHEGIWQLYVEFNYGAANIGATDGHNLSPSSIVAVKRIGIMRTPKLNNLSVDAAKINPKPKKARATKRRAKTTK